MQKLELESYFMKIDVVYEVETLTSIMMKTVVVQAMKELYGQVGSSVSIDVIKLVPEDANHHVAILRVPYKEVSRIWSALTMAGSYNEQTLLIQVVKISASLVGLAACSRTFAFNDCTT